MGMARGLVGALTIGALGTIVGCGTSGTAEEGPPAFSDVPLSTLSNPTPNDATTDDQTGRVPGDFLFRDGQILEIAVTLPAVDLQAIEEEGNEEIYFPAAATISGSNFESVALASVGFRHKGAWSLHHCWDDNGGVRNYQAECSKLSYKFKFNKFDDTGRLDGLKRLNLHASTGDPTRLHELMAYDTFRHFGVDAPRTAIIRLTVNGEFAGLFIGVEAIDGRYTKAHFPEGGGDGNLYKEVWPSPQVQEQAVVDSLRTNKEKSNVSAFLEFASAIGSSTPATFDANMDQWVDIDHLIRYIAVDRSLKNWDGIMAFYSPTSPHNFYWYHDTEGSGRFQLVPWDMDTTLWEFDPYMSPEQWVSAQAVPDWNITPSNCEPRSVWELNGGTKVTPPRCDPFLNQLAETHWQQFTRVGQQLRDDTFSTTRLLQRVDYFVDLLEPTIAEDPYLDLNQWLDESERFKQTLRRAATDFDAYLARGLSTEGN